MSQLLVIFATVFFAELGDKTQLATVLYAADSQQSRWLIFFAAAGRLSCRPPSPWSPARSRRNI